MCFRKKMKKTFLDKNFSVGKRFTGQKALLAKVGEKEKKNHLFGPAGRRCSRHGSSPRRADLRATAAIAMPLPVGKRTSGRPLRPPLPLRRPATDVLGLPSHVVPLHATDPLVLRQMENFI